MTKAKKPSSHTVFMRGKQCMSMVACEGSTLLRARVDKGICGVCEAALAKRQRKPRPPRGVGYLGS